MGKIARHAADDDEIGFAVRCRRRSIGGEAGCLAHEHGDCRDGHDDRLLGEGETAHPDEIQQAVDLGREPRYPDGCHGDGGEQANERDAEQIKKPE